MEDSFNNSNTGFSWSANSSPWNASGGSASTTDTPRKPSQKDAGGQPHAQKDDGGQPHAQKDAGGQPYAQAAQPTVIGSPSAKTEDEVFVEQRIQQIRKDLLGIGKDKSKVKARLRELQREYHPDKNPAEMSARVTPVFHYVQLWWEDSEGMFECESVANSH